MNELDGLRLKRVLIIDDDQALSLGLKRAIEKQGLIVAAENRSTQALETAVVFKPDLVVLDVMMPELDGWDVLTRLRANASTADVPVIMLTAADSQDAKLKGFSLGADDYLTKPFSVQELRCRIAAVIRRTARSATPADQPRLLPVVIGGTRTEFIRPQDVYYIEGVRNYSHVHTIDSRFLSRLTLGAIEGEAFPGFSRVHRSFIVNLQHVKGCGWASKSSYRLQLGNAERTEVPVSRTLVGEVQRALGLAR